MSQCTGMHGLAAGTIIYYLFPDSAALSNGYSTFLTNEKFTKQSGCTTNSNFVNFVAECQSDFTSSVVEHNRQHCRVR